jgi:hypothetical protein
MRRLKNGVSLVILTALVLGAWPPGQTQTFDNDMNVLPQQPTEPSHTVPYTQMPSSSPADTGKAVLQGGVNRISSLDEVMKAEIGLVDWYTWYLNCRQHIWSRGGLQCRIGTPIRITRDGRMTADTTDPDCLLSVRNKRFPLPEQTRLSVLILPVRKGSDPPASPTEIRKRTQLDE